MMRRSDEFSTQIGMVTPRGFWYGRRCHRPGVGRGRLANGMKDCSVLYTETAKNEGMTERQIADICIKAINDGDFKDANISLDGMIRSLWPVM